MQSLHWTAPCFTLDPEYILSMEIPNWLGLGKGCTHTILTLSHSSFLAFSSIFSEKTHCEDHLRHINTNTHAHIHQQSITTKSPPYLLPSKQAIICHGYKLLRLGMRLTWREHPHGVPVLSAGHFCTCHEGHLGDECHIRLGDGPGRTPHLHANHHTTCIPCPSQ